MADQDLEGLIAAAQASPYDDSPAMNEVLRRFDRLAKKIARSLATCEQLQDDLANEARIALVTAVKRHELGRPGFPRYAQAFMFRAAQRYSCRWADGRSDRVVQRLARLGPPTPAPAPDAPGLWGDGATADAVRGLPARQQHVLFQRHALDLPLAAIADDAGTSVSAVSQRLRTAEGAVQRALAA